MEMRSFGTSHFSPTKKFEYSRGDSGMRKGGRGERFEGFGGFANCAEHWAGRIGETPSPLQKSKRVRKWLKRKGRNFVECKRVRGKCKELVRRNLGSSRKQWLWFRIGNCWHTPLVFS